MTETVEFHTFLQHLLGTGDDVDQLDMLLDRLAQHDIAEADARRAFAVAGGQAYSLEEILTATPSPIAVTGTDGTDWATYAECPECLAPTGQGCVTRRSGLPRWPHLDRLRLAPETATPPAHAEQLREFGQAVTRALNEHAA